MEGILLDLARAILIDSIHRLESLAPIQNLILDLACLPLSEATQALTDKKLKIVNQAAVSRALAGRTWLASNKSMPLANKDVSRFNYIALYALETWLSSDKEMKKELASIAGEEPSLHIQE